MTLKLININYFKQELFNNNDLTIINCMLWIIKQELFSTWFILNVPGTCMYSSPSSMVMTSSSTKLLSIKIRRPKKKTWLKWRLQSRKVQPKRLFLNDLFNFLLSITLNTNFLSFIFWPTITFHEEVIYTLWGIMKLHFFCRDTMSPNPFLLLLWKREPLYVQRCSWNVGHLFFWVFQNKFWCISIWRQIAF